MKILCMGETLIRYSTKPGYRFSSMNFLTHIGGSETNIAVNLANFGCDVKYFTKLPSNPFGQSIISYLKANNVDTNSIIFSEGRIGSYYLEVGVGNRVSQVVYDRKYSTATTLNVEDVNLSKIFDKVDTFIVSGITLALGESVQNLVFKMLEYCQKHNIFVVYDNNYRAKMWSIEEAGNIFKKVLPYVNLLSAGILDAQNFLHLKSKENEYENKLLDYYMQIKASFPNIKYFISTKRDIISSNDNFLQGFCFSNELAVSTKYHITNIVDRVGGGDAFLAGFIYALKKKMNINEGIEFAVASSVLKHTILGDGNPVNEKEVLDLVSNGVGKIQR